jgi:hypothetical protein
MIRDGGSLRHLRSARVDEPSKAPISSPSLAELSFFEAVYFHAVCDGSPCFYASGSSVYAMRGEGLYYISGNGIFEPNGTQAFRIANEYLYDCATGEAAYYFRDPRPRALRPPGNEDDWDVGFAADAHAQQ